MPRRIPAAELIRRRIKAWQSEDPSQLISQGAEKSTASLQGLVTLLLPNSLIQEITQKTLWAAESLTDGEDVLKSLEVSSFVEAAQCKIDRCDALADQVHNWSMGTAAALAAWDLAGPLGTAPALLSLFTLALRTVKKIGLCYGFDTSSPNEETIVLEIFAIATGLSSKDRQQALSAVERLSGATQIQREDVVAFIQTQAKVFCTNLMRRRVFASIPAFGALVGSSSNAWLLKDVGWAARNIYAARRLQQAEQAAKTDAA